MKKEDIEKVVQLRSFLIGKYNTLDGAQQPAAMMRQSDVANLLESTIKEIDGLLKGKVNFD